MASANCWRLGPVSVARACTDVSYLAEAQLGLAAERLPAPCPSRAEAILLPAVCRGHRRGRDAPRLVALK